ncbi:type II toxin-antitoxin system antitoxin SocA domain-containing protein, partial [Mannheimia haemolytica]|nr:type II toxin-antitoxin system antitoxin SocA domain-containing protein [Mannheimia haemolytica]
MFDELKIAQATAYLLHKAGGTMEHIKVMKLLYLADRLSWQRYGYSISNDEYY